MSAPVPAPVELADLLAEVVAFGDHRRPRRRPLRRGVLLGVRLVALPLRLVRRVTALSFRTGVAVGRVPVRMTAGGARRLGVVGVGALVAGVLVGLVVAPVSGAQMRRRLRNLVVGARAVPDAELQRAVESALAAAPRTWHLPQPEVSVRSGVVTLRGQAPHDTARIELEAAAATVRGVGGVVNDLVVG